MQDRLESKYMRANTGIGIHPQKRYEQILKMFLLEYNKLRGNQHLSTTQEGFQHDNHSAE